VLFRRTVHLSVSSKHWAEVTYGAADPGAGFFDEYIEDCGQDGENNPATQSRGPLDVLCASTGRQGVECRSTEITGHAESTIQRRSTNRRVYRSRWPVVRRIGCSGYVGPFHLEAMQSSVSLRVAGSRYERAMRGFHNERPRDSGSEGHCT